MMDFDEQIWLFYNPAIDQQFPWPDMSVYFFIFFFRVQFA